MEKGANDPLLIEAMSAGKGQGIDAAEVAVLAFAHQALDGGDGFGVSRLPQGGEQGVGFAHHRKVVRTSPFAITICCGPAHFLQEIEEAR